MTNDPPATALAHGSIKSEDIERVRHDVDEHTPTWKCTLCEQPIKDCECRKNPGG